ncbi:hypothetical protein Poly24_03860 [Rosistilla carotiformis]|uniref:Uncharacterized protein n=1 Tax=Rosistilla carotiformis TaxID=2528017 RepID=A0A518JMC0_9BACT|nr:hypothetical protein Poly24_03860 [Rosistilla carotiformis]
MSPNGNIGERRKANSPANIEPLSRLFLNIEDRFSNPISFHLPLPLRSQSARMLKLSLIPMHPTLTSLAALYISLSLLANAASADEPFRPEPGTFPPLEKSHSYRGELVFVDHANRRGSIRVQSIGVFRRNAPHPFAMLPYGIVRYRGAPADLRDIPLGTIMHVRAFLPPDPTISAVPVLPVDNRKKTVSLSGVGIAPAENHVLLLEDEPSYCQREGKVWKLKEVNLQNNQGMVLASLEAKQSDGDDASVESMTFDAATRIWRGRERLSVKDLIDEGNWPASGKKSLGGQAVLLGLTWKPTPGGVFTRFHISDIWLDGTAMQRATDNQNEVHKAFIRGRWMPAWVDAVEYGKFGHATVTATLFGGMDASLYADFKQGIAALMNAAENTLKHTEGGTAGPSQMAARGSILEVTTTPGDVPLGSSGIQIRFEMDLITEGIRPTRVVRIRPANWPDVHVPREEYLSDGASSVNERFPTPDIFPKY